MPCTMVNAFEHQIRLDLVRGMLVLGMLPGQYNLDLEVITRKYNDVIGRLKTEPLVLRGIDGNEYLCDSRYMGFSRKEVVRILEWDIRSSSMMVTDGKVTVQISVQFPGRVYDCRKYVKGPESAIDRFTRMIFCNSTLEETCGLAHDCDLLEDLNKLPAEKFPFIPEMSLESRIVLLLAGLMSVNELCLKCAETVKISKETGVKGRTAQYGTFGNQTQRDALRGDLLQKYHFLTLAEYLAQSSAYVRIGELFTNSQQRKFLELPDEWEVRKKYSLSPHNNDHTWGTAVEAEYQLCHEFRLRFMRYICCEICDWIVSDTLLKRVLFLEKD